jgi:ABC-type sugar transport system ATPase subunit
MLEAEGISKAYGGVVALSGAGLRVRAGSVHALLGENGAGKSTLVKVIAGAVKPDSGVLRLDGEEVSFSSTAEAARHGVGVVSQELSLFPDLDVLSNLYPMREPRRGPFVNRHEMWRRAEPVLVELGLEVQPRQPLATLSLAERQLVEVAKALITNPRVLWIHVLTIWNVCWMREVTNGMEPSRSPGRLRRFYQPVGVLAAEMIRTIRITM